MKRLLLFLVLLLAAWAGPARAADGIPPRPKPFTFVTDQAGLLQPADAKKLENGLRRYADNTGTQVVVVTVPSLGGQNVNEFARQLGTEWGVGQKGKNNGLVVLVASQEHKLSIEPGQGLRATITPAVIRQTIGEMTPSFKQNNYFAGLRQGLNTLMATANPGSAPAATAGSPAASSAPDNSAPDNSAALNSSTTTTQTTDYPAGAAQPEEASSPGGFSFMPIILGIVVIGGGLWLLSKLFRRGNNAASGGGSPTFYPNQRPAGGQPTFYPNQGPPPAGGYGYGALAQSSGPGIGGMLATGAAAAAGAYLGNRMAGDHDSGSHSNFSDTNTNYGAGTGAGAAGGTAAADDYFASRGGGGESSGPDYFSDNSSDSSNDYFSGNDNSYDDSSSGDVGGGGFDDTNDNSGSW